MDDKKIVYDSNEISNIISKIDDNTSIIETDILSSIHNDFNILKDLELFHEGLDDLEIRINKSLSMNNKLIDILNDHDIQMNELDKKHLSLFNEEKSDNNDDEVIVENTINVDNIELNKIADSKLILSEYIDSVVFNSSYEKKLVLLKDILNNNSLSIITDTDQADILIYQLKEYLKKDYPMELTKLLKDEEKEIQKSFFDAISSNDTNIFDEIEEDSFLKGFSYLKQVSAKNDLSVSDLIFDDKNNALFMNAMNEIYNSNQMDILTNNELDSVKNYINGVAEKYNISPLDLLKGETYISALKGGISYED